MPPSDPWLVQSWRLQTEEVRIRRRNIHCAWLDEFAALAIAEVAERRSAQIRTVLSAELKLRQALFIAELVECRAIVLEQEITQRRRIDRAREAALNGADGSGLLRHSISMTVAYASGSQWVARAEQYRARGRLVDSSVHEAALEGETRRRTPIENGRRLLIALRTPAPSPGNPRASPRAKADDSEAPPQLLLPASSTPPLQAGQSAKSRRPIHNKSSSPQKQSVPRTPLEHLRAHSTRAYQEMHVPSLRGARPHTVQRVSKAFFELMQESGGNNSTSS